MKKQFSTLVVVLLTIFTIGYLGKLAQTNFRDTISKLFKLK